MSSYFFVGQSAGSGATFNGGTVPNATTFSSPVTFNAATIASNTAGYTFADGTVLSSPANGSLRITDNASTGMGDALFIGSAALGLGVKVTANAVAALTGPSGSGTGILTGQFGAAGSAAGPGFYATASGNSGLYFPSGSTLGLSTNGVAALTLDSSQNATFSANVSGVGGTFSGPLNGGGTQASAGNLGVAGYIKQAATNIAASQTLTANQVRSTIIQLTGSTASQTLTLPAGVTGYTLSIVNNSTQNWTIAANGAATWGGGAASYANTHVINPNTNIILECTGTNWACTSANGTVT